MFRLWRDKYPPEVSDALVLSSRSMADLFKNVGRKLRDVEDHFRRYVWSCSGFAPMPDSFLPNPVDRLKRLRNSCY
jgi:hypothetical protein